VLRDRSGVAYTADSRHWTFHREELLATAAVGLRTLCLHLLVLSFVFVLFGGVSYTIES
jgi:hypothetical protein